MQIRFEQLFDITLFISHLGNRTKALLFQGRFNQAKAIMKQIHWNSQDGIWYDYDLGSKRHHKEYYISNSLPLFAHCYDDEETPKKVFEYMKVL